MENMKERLLQYVSKAASGVDVKMDDDIFEMGLVHSLFAMQLILFIEKEFDIELEDKDLDFKKIRTVNDIAELVMSRT